MALVSNIPTNILACCDSVGLKAAVAAASATLGTSTNHKLGFTTNDTLRATLDASGNLGIGTDSPGAKLDVRGTVILNETGGDYDVRMEGDTDANLFFLDASTDRIGIGTATPNYLFSVAGNAGFDEYLYHNGDADTYIRFRGDQLDFVAGGMTFLTLDESAGVSADTVTVNGSTDDIDFLVNSDDGTQLIRTDAENNRVGIGTATPSHLLDVEGVANFATCIVTPTVCTTGDTVIGGDLTVAGDDITLGTNTSGYIIVADGTNYNPVAVSGDVTLSSAGAVTIAAGAVENSMLANCVITLADGGGNSTAIALGGTMSFNGTSNEVEVSESSGTLTVGLPSTVSGLTTVSATNLTGTLSTAAQANITSVGTLTSICTSGAITAGGVITGSTLCSSGDLVVAGDDITMGTNTSGHILVADGTNYNPVAISGDVAIDSAGAVTIQALSVDNSMLAGSIANAKLSNSSVSYGGVSVSLGASDGTPAFNLSDATAYPGDSSLVTVGTISSGTWQGTAIATGYIATTLTGKTLTSPVLNGTLSGTAFLDEDNFASNSDIAAASQQSIKAYVDAVASGLDLKCSSHVATTACLTSTYNNGSSGVGATLTNAGTQAALSIDGQTMVAAERALIKDQTAACHNGIYTVTTVGDGSTNWVMTRATDFDTSTNITSGAFTFVETGTTNADAAFVMTTDGAITVGTTVINWAQFSGAGQITAGAGLTKSGSTINVGAGSNITVNADDVALSTTITGLSAITSTAITGTLQTAAQANITSVGTLTSLCSSGDITLGGDLTIAGDDLFMTTNTSGYLLIADGTNYNPTAVSGDVTINSSGATTIGATTVTNAMLAGSIANAKLSNSSVSYGGISVSLGSADATPAFDLTDATNYPTSSLVGTITNTQLAGSIANAKLANSTITVSDGSNTTAIALGGTATFSGTSNEVEVAESSGTVTIGLPSTVSGLTNVSATNLTGTLATAAQANVTSVGTLTSLAVSGDITIDTTTLKVNSTTNRVGIGTATPSHLLDVEGVANVATCIITPIYCVASEYVLPSADGSAGQVMCTDGSGGLAFATNTPASPGGSDTFVQFNDGSSFGGSANFTWDDTTVKASNFCTAGTATLATVDINAGAIDGTTIGAAAAAAGTFLAIVGTTLTASGNVSFDGGTFIFNETGADKDFRIEGDTEANLFITDASTDRIGVGTATPSHLVDIEGVAHASTCFVSADLCATTKVVGAALCVGGAFVLPTSDGSAGQVMCTDGSGGLAFATNTPTSPGGSDTYVQFNNSGSFGGSANLTWDDTTLATTAFTATGNVSLNGGTFVFNEAGADKDFRIEGDSEANLFITDASTDRIGIGTATPSHLVDIEGVGHASTCFVSADLCATTKIVGAAICMGGAYALPTSDGTAGYILCTDGSGAVGFAEAAGGGHTIAEEGTPLASRTCLNFVGTAVTATDNAGTNATDVSIGSSAACILFTTEDGSTDNIVLTGAATVGELECDSSPALGGNLDVTGYNLYTSSNNNICLAPNGTGKVCISTDLLIGGDDLYMATNTSGYILVADGTNYNPVAISGDVTISSAGAITIAAGAVENSMLANCTISYGGVQLVLGGTDATPAFDLSDATAYVGDSALVTVGTIASGTWQGTAIATGYIAGTLASKTLSDPVLTGTISGNAFLDEDNMASDSATKVASQQSIKAYVDSVASGLDIKFASHVATTCCLTSTYSNGSSGVGATLSATSAGGLEIDGQTLVSSERVLIKDQTAACHNGIYTVTNTGGFGQCWVITRATDFDGSTEVTSGEFTFVETGTTNADSGWVMTTDGTVTIGTTAINWSQFSGAGQITAGAGLTKSANTLAVGAGSNITVNADDVALSTTITGLTALTATTLTGTLATAAQTNVTSLGSLSSLCTTGDICVGADVHAATCIVSPAYCVASEFAFPTADGTAGYIMCTNGSGTVAWVANSGGHTIAEEGSALATRTCLNFIGVGVTATDNSGTDATDVTVGATSAELRARTSDGTQCCITLSSAAIGPALVCDTTPQLGGNLDVNGNSIVSVSNGNIPITPHGTGSVVISKFSVTGDISFDGGSFVFNESGADKDFRIEGDTDANLFITDASTDRIGIGTATPSHLLDVEGVAHVATCIVTPKVCITSQYALPASDGSAGQILCTDGSGATTFAAAASSGHTISEEGSALASRTCLNFIGSAVTATDNSFSNATDVTVCATSSLLGVRMAAGTACCITLSSAAVGESLVSDTTPQLGGNLDVNGNSIVSASNGNIPITPNGSGIVIIDGICHPIADGSAGQLLCTDGSAALKFATAAAGVTLAGSTNNTVATVTGSNALAGEANLTFDGSILTVGTSIAATADTNTSIGLPGSDVMTFSTGGTEALRINAEGNIGIKTVPNVGWHTDQALIQLGTVAIWTNTHDETAANSLAMFSNNLYQDSADEWRYIVTDEASRYYQNGGGHYFDTAPSGSAGAAVGFTTRLKIDTAGLVGIGTGTPGNTLHVYGSGNIAKLQGSSGTEASMAFTPASGNGWQLGAGPLTANTFQLYENTAAVPRITVTEGGNIDFASSGAMGNFPLRVESCVSGGNLWVFRVVNAATSNTNGMQIYFSSDDPDNNTEAFFQAQGNSGNVRMRVYTSGDVWTSDSGVLSSDERLKTNIVDASDKLANVMRLQVRNFEWTPEYHPNQVGEKKIGFIAQEFETVFPSLVSDYDIATENSIAEELYEEEDVIPEGAVIGDVKVAAKDHEPMMRKGIKSSLTPILVKALQEVTTRLEAAEAKIAELEKG